MPEYQLEKSESRNMFRVEGEHVSEAKRQLDAGAKRTGDLRTAIGFPATDRMRPHALLQLQRSHGNRYVQRMLAIARQADGAGAVSSDVESSIERMRGGGMALDSAPRHQMESAFGVDFGGVRIHTGAESHSLNRAVSAVAFTTGQDIFFREGAYDPGSSGGRELLAHELTHVVQQGGAPATTGKAQRFDIQRMCPACEEEKKAKIQGKLVVGEPGDSYEREAEQVGRSIAATLDSPHQIAHMTAGQGNSVSSSHLQCSCGAPLDSHGECQQCRKKRELAARGQGELGSNSLLSSAAVLQRAPFDPGGTDVKSCEDKINEDGAVCADHANTVCSVGGAAAAGSTALIGAGIGTLLGPGGALVGGVIGGLVGGVGGALAYGKCVENINAACRARTRKSLALCDQKFASATGASATPATPTMKPEDLPNAPPPVFNAEDLPKAQ